MTTENNHLLAEEIQLADTTSTDHSFVQTTNHDEVHEVVEEVDYKTWTKEALLKAFYEAAKAPQVQQALRLATKLKTALEEKIQEEKHFALDKFIAEGGVEDDSCSA